MKYVQLRRPQYRAHQFMGLADIDKMKILTKCESYTLTSDNNGDLTICIAHWHVPQGSWLVKEPSGIFRVLDDIAFNKEYEDS